MTAPVGLLSLSSAAVGALSYGSPVLAPADYTAFAAAAALVGTAGIASAALIPLPLASAVRRHAGDGRGRRDAATSAVNGIDPVARTVAVVPSRLATFGIVAAGALATGTSVVAFDIDCLREVVPADCGGLVPRTGDPRRDSTGSAVEPMALHRDADRRERAATRIQEELRSRARPLITEDVS